MTTSLIVLGCLVLLVLFYVLIIKTKVPEIETDYLQIKLQIEECLNQDELADAVFWVNDFVDKYERNKRCWQYFRILRRTSQDKYHFLINNTFTHELNIHEHSK